MWASVAKEPAEVIEEAFLDACSRDPKREKKWVVLVDGNADQIARVRGGEETSAEGHDRPRCHPRTGVPVESGYVFRAEGTSEAANWVSERLLWLLCGEAGQVIASIPAQRDSPRAQRRSAEAGRHVR